MTRPHAMGGHVEAFEARVRSGAGSPLQQWRLVGEMATSARDVTADVTQEPGGDLACTANPLAPVLQELAAKGATSAEDASQLRASWRLRLQVARVLHAALQADRLRVRGLGAMAQVTSPDSLLRQLVPWEGSQDDGWDAYDAGLSGLDMPLLQSGMGLLVQAVQELELFMAKAGDLPSVTWDWESDLGRIIVDTTSRSQTWHLNGVLLLVDDAGDDTFYFHARPPSNRISVVLDRAGADRYIALAPGADPSAGLLGYGILWDVRGDDRYEAEDFAYASALFGMSLLYDGGGRDRYSARGFAQGFALAGAALLLDAGGDDHYEALSHAQASAASRGVAVLLDAAGDDSYVLGNVPLLLPSPQVPQRNVSMGQGAARGGLGASPGGVAALVDLSGDDRYEAQVFAQGAGYRGGLGILLDGGGKDHMSAAWYALGAGAHEAIGIFIARGNDDDKYVVSHSTSFAAAHDGAMALFIEEGGDDAYELGNLGFGAVSESGFALFIDGAGSDRFVLRGRPCVAFGVFHAGANGGRAGESPGVFWVPAAPPLACSAAGGGT
jgi:hypothetical protein